MNLKEFIEKEVKTTINGMVLEGRPIPMDTPNEFTYIDFKKYAYKNRKMFKKELQKSNGDSSKMFLTLSALWYKWAKKNHKEFTHIKDSKKFGRALMIMMVKDDLIFSIDAFNKTNNIAKLKEDSELDQAFLKAKPVEEETKRDYKKEYEKYGKSKKAKKYRAELNKYNRQKGTYGNGDGKDASHKGGKIVGFEDESKNRGRREKSRLKKEGMVSPKRGHDYYQLTKDTPIKYISGHSGIGLEVPGVLLHNEYGTFKGKKGAYIIDYFGRHFYVDIKNKFASDIANPKSSEQTKGLMKNVKVVDKAPEFSDWKKYLKESVNEGPIDRVIGGRPYEYIGDGRKGKAIVSGPMKDKERTEIIKRAKKAGYSAAPAIKGGVVIHIESVNEEQLDEKLITFSNRAPYGQIVFMAGGAGSGKGFAIDNFIDAAGFRVRDVDEMKKAVGKLDQLGKFSVDKWYKKYYKKLSDKPGKGGGLSPKAHVEEFVLGKGLSISDISKDLKNPNNVASLHYIVDSMGLKDKWLISMLSGKNNKETLPNLLFDITAKKVSSITDVIKPLIANGYDSKNVHLIWVLSNFHVAIQANKERDRMVPEDILLQTHEGAGKTMWEVMTKILPKGLNGRIDVILNNRKRTIPYKDKDGNPIKVEPNQQNKLEKARIVVKDFRSLPIKKQGGGILPEKTWKMKLKSWILDNAPKTIDLSQQVDEGKNDYFKSAGEAVEFAKKSAEKKGFDIDEDDWNSQITMGGKYNRLRPGVGKTHSFQIGLLKKGKPQRKGLAISLYGMDSGKYELTHYIN